jgi:hypothetical protein
MLESVERTRFDLERCARRLSRRGYQPPEAEARATENYKAAILRNPIGIDVN